MKSPRIAVVGSSNTDLMIKLPRIPRPGETIMGGEYITAAGGKGANQAVAAARCGGKVAFVARVGSDDLGSAAIARLEREGIDVTQVTRDPAAPSGVALIFIGERGENCIGVASGANGFLSAEDVARAAAVITSAAVVVLQLETPLATVAAAAEAAARAGAMVLLNPAPACAVSAELLRHVTVLTPNEHEAGLLAGVDVHDEATATAAARILLAQGPRAVVITLGAKGCLLATAEDVQRVPGFAVAPVDTTAAGDTFNGALAVALGEGMPLPEATRFANAAAAISVTRLGAQSSAPSRREVLALLSSAEC